MKTAKFVLAAALTALAAPLSASEPEVARAVVQYSDLDLTTDAGQAALARRIASTARSVCGLGTIRTGTILPPPGAMECYRNARASAHKRIAERVASARSRG